MKNAIYALAVVAVIWGAGCESPYQRVDPKTGVPILPEPQESIDSSHAGLTVSAALSHGDCSSISNALRASAIRAAYTAIQQSFESAWNEKENWCNYNNDWPSGGYWDGGASADAGVAPTPSPDDTTTPDHSDTNNQVASVDEPDVVKTDGKFIYLADRTGLHIVKSWPADQTATISHLALQGTPKKLFVHGDRALIYSSLGAISNGYGYGYYGGYDSGCTYGYNCVPRGDGNATKITVVDISDRNAPKIVRELDIQSSLLSARRIGNAVHTVLTRASEGTSATVSTYPEGLDVCDSTKLQIYRAFEKLLAQQMAKLAKTDFTAQLPSLTDTTIAADGKKTQRTSDPLRECSSFWRASISDGDQFTSVLSLRIDNETPATAVTILSRAGVTYASAQSLYLAVPYARSAQYEWFGSMSAFGEATALHKFKLDSEGARADYSASGLVKGRVLNQFALDEHDDALRIASTTGHVGGGSSDSSVHNTLTVLQQSGRTLEKIGQVDGLGPGEDIRSVRFDGERGYVVTFKKTDPLFVLDLSDPRKPSVLGELKIPGFSTYMHRMDKNHLLTIGYDADDQGNFAWFQGVMLQIFDVTNPTKPSLKFKHIIGTRGSSSEALTNHLAFTYYAPKNVLALPMTVCEGSQGGGSYGYDLTFSGLMVFDVTVDTGFALHGKVSYPLPEIADYGYPYYDNSASCGNWWSDASSQVKRSIIIGDYVYSLSNSLLKVNALADLSHDIATLKLDLQ